MKKSLLCFLILLMVPLASVAYDFEVDEIYFPFKQNLFVVIVHKYVFHPQQLEKKFQFTAGSFPEFIDQYYGSVIFALIRLRLVCVTPK